MKAYFKADCFITNPCSYEVLEPESSPFDKALSLFMTYCQNLDDKVVYILAQRNADKRFVNRKRRQMMRINSELEQGSLTLETFKDDFNTKWATDYNELYSTSAALLDKMKRYMKSWMDLLEGFSPNKLPTNHDIEVRGVKPRDAREISPLADGAYMPYLYDITTLTQEVQLLLEDIHKCYGLYIKCFSICQEIIKEEEEIKKSPLRTSALYVQYMSEVRERLKDIVRLLPEEFIRCLKKQCPAYKDYEAANTEEEFACNGFHKYNEIDAHNFGHILLYDNSHNMSETEKKPFADNPQKAEETRYIIKHFDELLPAGTNQPQFAFYQYAFAKWACPDNIRNMCAYFKENYRGNYQCRDYKTVNAKSIDYHKNDHLVNQFTQNITNLIASRKKYS